MIVIDLKIFVGVSAEEYHDHVGQEDRINDPIQSHCSGMLDVEAHFPGGPKDTDDQNEGHKDIP